MGEVPPPEIQLFVYPLFYEPAKADSDFFQWNRYLTLIFMYSRLKTLTCEGNTSLAK